jgi:aminoglycoside phosphotransferase (APT) family kinase protein
LSVSEEEPLSPEAASVLQNWLARRLPGGERLAISNISKPSSGFSAVTLLIDLENADREGDTRRVVARIETPDPPVYPRQAPDHPDNPGDIEVALQYRVMEALHKAGGIPLAPLVGYEADIALLGQPFFVMDYVSGDVPKESPPYPTEGFFTEIPPETRSTMLRNGLTTLATLHTVPWRELGLDWLVPPGREPGTAQQMAVWRQYADDELAGREHPLMESAWKWLEQRMPAKRDPGLAWGDPRPGNIIWRDGEVATITDFEAASIAQAEQDLGWWLMFDRTMHEAVGAERLPGDLTRDEQCEHYARVSGRDVSDIRWYEIFAAARYCAIVVRVMNRAVARGMMSPDQTVWLNNPASDALTQLMDG